MERQDGASGKVDAEEKKEAAGARRTSTKSSIQAPSEDSVTSGSRKHKLGRITSPGMNSQQRGPNSRRSQESQHFSFQGAAATADLNPTIPPAESLIFDREMPPEQSEVKVLYQIMMSEQANTISHEQFRVRFEFQKDSSQSLISQLASRIKSDFFGAESQQRYRVICMKMKKDDVYEEMDANTPIKALKDAHLLLKISKIENTERHGQSAAKIEELEG